MLDLKEYQTKPWMIYQTYDDVRVAKIHAGRLLVFKSGTKVKTSSDKFLVMYWEKTKHEPTTGL